MRTSGEAGMVCVGALDRRVVRRVIGTPLGAMVLGASAEGVCLCEFADRRALGGEVRELEAVFGGAMVEGTSEHLESMARELREYFAGERREFVTPLHAPGTPFQRLVWERLRGIPYGRTMSYGELAAALGRPGASRAVGRANGQNRIAIVIPCHRVIESTGALRGYGGGLQRKKWLLDLEREYAGGTLFETAKG